VIRWLLTGVSTVSLAVNGLLLWQADGFPHDLPRNGVRWVEAYLNLFTDPFSAYLIFGLTLALTLSSFCITELLLGLVFVTLSAFLALLCLIGQVSIHYPPLAHILIQTFQ
jgi:hypothetical protein